MLVKTKDAIKKIIYRIVPPPYSNISYSQSGEDCIISFLLDQLKINSPSYLELGVCDPIKGSNTYRFYKNGGTGVLVEADPSQISMISKIRPNDKILNYAVGPVDNKIEDFYIFEESAHNTLVKEEAENRIKNGSFKLINTQKVTIKTINTIIKENFERMPDLLSIDIEGMDLTVLQNLDLNQYPIPIICAETCTYSENHIRPKDFSIQNFMQANGYFIYADTYLNTIFVNEKWFTSYKNK